MPELIDDPVQRQPVDQLHGVEMQSPFAPNRIYRHDVVVMQLRGSLRFLPKPLQVLRVQAGGERQHFQRDAAAQRKLNGLVNDPHAASADLLNDLKIADRLCRAASRCRRWADCRGGADGSRRLVHEVQAIQAIAQGGGEIRVTGQPLVPIRMASLLQLPQVGLHGLEQSPFIGSSGHAPSVSGLTPSFRTRSAGSLIARPPSPVEDGPVPAPTVSRRYPDCAHPLRDLREGQPLQMPENEHFAIVLREFRQRVGEQDRLFAADGLLAWRAVVIQKASPQSAVMTGPGFRERPFQADVSFLSAEVSPDTRAENRRHDLSEPSHELGFAGAPEVGEALVGLQHGFLDEVGRVHFGLEPSTDFDAEPADAGSPGTGPAAGRDARPHRKWRKRAVVPGKPTHPRSHSPSIEM